jgi:hypothetical protein
LFICLIPTSLLCFSNCFSVYWLKVGHPNIFLYLFLLILGILLTYKFVILEIKIIRLNFFFMFLKYRSSFHGLNKLVIKSKNTCKKNFFNFGIKKIAKSCHVFLFLLLYFFYIQNMIWSLKV